MDLDGHLTFLITLCGTIMGLAGVIDIIIGNHAKRQIFSQVKKHNFVFIKNRKFLIDLLKSLFRCRTKQIHFRRHNLVVVFPDLKRFALIHFILVIGVIGVLYLPREFLHISLVDGPSEIPNQTTLDPKILILLSVSLYICTILFSFPLDFVSAVKTLTFATLVSEKSKRVRLAIVFLDILITILLAYISAFGLVVLFVVFDFQPSESILSWLGRLSSWYPDLPRIYMQIAGIHATHSGLAVVVMMVVTGLVILVTFALHIASMMWFLLDKLRKFRLFSVRYLNLKTLPFTIAGFLFCSILVLLYCIATIILILI